MVEILHVRSGDARDPARGCSTVKLIVIQRQRVQHPGARLRSKRFHPPRLSTRPRLRTAAGAKDESEAMRTSARHVQQRLDGVDVQVHADLPVIGRRSASAARPSATPANVRAARELASHPSSSTCPQRAGVPPSAAPCCRPRARGGCEKMVHNAPPLRPRGGGRCRGGRRRAQGQGRPHGVP